MQAVNQQKKPSNALVTIWCKLNTDDFSHEIFNKTATGQEIYDFLMKDAGKCIDKDGQVIPGDCNLWYLGTTDSFGMMLYKDKPWLWGIGESSFFKVECFVWSAYLDGLVSEEQLKILAYKICEGKLIGHFSRINEYLLCKKNGEPWRPVQENTREVK